MTDTVLQDLRHALAALARTRGVAAVAIITLALGIGATTTMFSVVNRVANYELGFAQPDRLAVLWTTEIEKFFLRRAEQSTTTEIESVPAAGVTM
jgi:putative ABC transport system permease protein